MVALLETIQGDSHPASPRVSRRVIPAWKL